MPLPAVLFSRSSERPSNREDLMEKDESSATNGTPNEGPDRPPRRNLAARAAHWSANHRKLAIWGWLGFVVLAVLVGNVVTQDKIHGAEQFTGESSAPSRPSRTPA